MVATLRFSHFGEPTPASISGFADFYWAQLVDPEGVQYELRDGWRIVDVIESPAKAYPLPELGVESLYIDLSRVRGYTVVVEGDYDRVAA